MRLDKYVAQAMQLTRSEARARIARGAVLVNGQVCKKADTALKPQDEVAAAGQQLEHRQFVYLMLHKPQGVVSASTDRRDTTVVDLVKEAFPRRQLFPAGRLDKTSTGFVLLTDDGTFAHAILAPKRHVPKTYWVRLDTPVTQEMVQAFEQGVTLADGHTMLPARLLPDPQDTMAAQVVLRQGVYHQIKRMFGVLGAGVDQLHRSAIGEVRLDDSLAPGQWREMTAQEVEQLAKASGITPGK